MLVSLEGEDGLLLVASPLAEKVLEGGFTVEATLRGEDLEGLRYEPLYDPFSAGLPRASLRRFEVGAAAPTAIDAPAGRETPGSESSWQIHVADFVSMDDGSGIVHVAPAFGQEDYLLGTQKRLLFVQNVDVQGRIVGDYPGCGPLRQGGGRAHHAGPSRAGAAVPPGGVPPHLPLLLALRCAAALLLEALLVHPDDGAAGAAGLREPGDQLAAGAHQGGALRRVAAQQRGLGHLPGALLGHAAAPSGAAKAAARPAASGALRSSARAPTTRAGRRWTLRTSTSTAPTSTG